MPKRHPLTDEQCALLKTQGLVYLVDDDEALRVQLATVLMENGLKLKQFSSAEAFLSGMSDHCPAVIVSDMALPGLSGLDLLKTVREAGYQTPLIFISGYSQPDQIINGMKLGAVDFLWKPFKPDVLVSTVFAALNEDLQRAEKHRAFAATQILWDTLSEREQEVCGLMLKGYGNTEIAQQLDIQPDTANKHRIKVLRKLNVKGRPELTELLKGFEPAHR